MKRFLLLTILMGMLFGCCSVALAADTLTWKDNYANEVKLDIDSQEVSAWIGSAVDAALKATPVEAQPSTYTQLGLILGEKQYKVDVHYNTATEYVLSDGEKAYPLDRMTGKMLFHLSQLNIGRKTALSFSVSDEVKTLFENSGYTPAYHIADVKIKLPARIECKNTSSAGTYFSFVTLVLEDGGWDLSKYCKKDITAEIYGLYEHCDGGLFSPEWREYQGENAVLVPMRAVVLRCRGDVIGAYLTCDQYPTWMMSVKGKTSLELLGDKTVENYLREHYTMTPMDRKIARLSPEKVIKAWVKAANRKTANLYEPLENWLLKCAVDARDDQLYITVASQQYEPLAPKGLKTLQETSEYNTGGTHYYDAGITYISVCDYGMGIGWKVMGFGGF